MGVRNGIFEELMCAKGLRRTKWVWKYWQKDLRKVGHLRNFRNLVAVMVNVRGRGVRMVLMWVQTNEWYTGRNRYDGVCKIKLILEFKCCCAALCTIISALKVCRPVHRLVLRKWSETFYKGSTIIAYVLHHICVVANLLEGDIHNARPLLWSDVAATWPQGNLCGTWLLRDHCTVATSQPRQGTQANESLSRRWALPMGCQERIAVQLAPWTAWNVRAASMLKFTWTAQQFEAEVRLVTCIIFFCSDLYGRACVLVHIKNDRVYVIISHAFRRCKVNGVCREASL